MVYISEYYTISLMFDLVIFIFLYVFTLKMMMFWDIIFNEKIKQLYEQSTYLKEEERNEIYFSVVKS